MRIIELDATNWVTVGDFYSAVLAALGAPDWHGVSVDALIDSMVWGEINAVEPPYIVRILGAKVLSAELRTEIETARRAIADACGEFRNRRGHDVVVSLELVP